MKEYKSPPYVFTVRNNSTETKIVSLFDQNNKPIDPEIEIFTKFPLTLSGVEFKHLLEQIQHKNFLIDFVRVHTVQGKFDSSIGFHLQHGDIEKEGQTTSCKYLFRTKDQMDLSVMEGELEWPMDSKSKWTQFKFELWQWKKGEWTHLL